MSLEFFIVDIGQEIANAADLFAAMELSNPAPFELFNDEFDKLAPWVFACRRAGIEVGLYFDDTFLCSHQIRPVLDILRECYGEIATRRPFYHADDWQKEPFVRMVKILETAIAKRAGVVAFCD